MSFFLGRYLLNYLGDKCPWNVLSNGKKQNKTQVWVAHACNPSYSGGRDQGDHRLKPALVNSSRDPISKKPITKKGWWSGSSDSLPSKCEAQSSNHSATKKKKKRIF
jgi:hypothetical protein